MSNFLEGIGLFEEAESKEVSLNSSKNDSIIKSKGIEYLKNKTIYEKPKYQEVKNTYEILKPITKQIMELPIQTKKKIKTTKTIYQKEIIVENEEELNKILNGENIEDIPLPTKSTIQNLIKDSIIVSNTTSSKEQSNNIFKSQKLKSENILLNNKNNNNDNNLIKSQVNSVINKLNLKNDINNNKYNNIYLSHANNNNNKIKIKNSKNPGAFKEQNNNIEYKNKNYIETYFHDDDIPKPEVCEGNGLEFSDMKIPNEENNEIKKSKESNDSNNQIKDLLDNLPIEHTVLLPNQPKVDMSKIQKENMMNKSNNTEISKTINLNNQIINNQEKKFYYKSQALNINNNIYNKNNYNNNININKSMKNYNKNNNNNELPIPEMDINNYNINNNNNYINENKNKIKPKMELYNKNKNNINNKSKVSNPSSSSGGSLISQTSVTENHYINNKKNKK